MVWRGISGRGARSERGHGMATIQRPVKTYGNRTYVAEVAAAPSNQDPILANEVDGDIDTIYAAWNGGADAVNIKDEAISRAKLSTTDVLPSLPPIPIATDANKTVVVNTAGNGLVLGTGGTFAGPTPPATPQVGQLWWRSDPDGNLFIYYDDGNSKQFVPAVPSSVGPWSVSGSTITPTDATKNVRVTLPSAPAENYVLGATGVTGKTRLCTNGGKGGFSLRWNAGYAAVPPDDTTVPSWVLNIDAQADGMQVYRAPATTGNPAWVQLLGLDNVGNLTVGSVLSAGMLDVNANCNSTVPGWVQSRPGWLIRMANGVAADPFYLYHRSANAANPDGVYLQIDSGGNLTIAGATATK